GEVMLTETQYRQYITFTHQLSAPAKEYLWVVRNSQPSRMVGVHAKTNVCSWMVSEKMRWTISVESRTAERAFVVIKSDDDEVFEIWDQLPVIQVKKVNKKGKYQTVSHTPDFLILTVYGPRVIEVKPLEVI